MIKRKEAAGKDMPFFFARIPQPERKYRGVGSDSSQCHPGIVESGLSSVLRQAGAQQLDKLYQNFSIKLADRLSHFHENLERGRS